jgi:hypothetical protein
VPIGLGYVRYAVAEPGMFRTAFCRTDKPPEAAVDRTRSTNSFR